MINSCNERFGTEITCSQVCHDGHDVKNLIKNYAFQPFVFKNGFMADSFVKPPIDVTIDFPVKFEISHIILQTCVGAQKTSYLEMFYSIMHDKKARTNADYSFLAKINCEKYDSVCVFNDCYSQRRSSTLINDVENRFQCIIRRRSRMCIASAIKLTIKRTINGSVPALNRIEIWGYPEKSCPKTELDQLLKNLQVPKKEHNINYEKKILPSSNLELKTMDQQNVPSEFLDSITCELMTLPVILPSGHTIDRSTLDKHCKAEEQWGRSANDPFTGLVFGKDSQPLPNVPLKARIDNFILKNNHLFHSIPRTIGRDPSVKRKFPQAYASTVCGVKSKSDSTVSSPECSLAIPDSKKVKLENGLETESEPKCHEEHLSSSLSSAIGELLQRSFLKKNPIVEKQEVCVLCGCVENRVLYRNGCEHLLCGPCLKQNVKKCSCGHAVIRDQIHRVHL